MNVVLPEVSGSLALGRIRMRSHSPHRRHRDGVDRADLVDADQVAVVPVRWFECLAVDPLGRLPVPLDLHVLLEGLGADCAALVEQGLDLAQDERVPLEGGGVVRLEVPDV
jgi:hypothetical protein